MPASVSAAPVQAIVPTRILRKWDRLAAIQLCDVARFSAEEIDRLRSDVRAADESLEFWRAQAERLHEELAAATGKERGITQSGALVLVKS